MKQQLVTKSKIRQDVKLDQADLDHNRDLFQEVRALNLPDGQYCLTGSAPLGIRGLRKINDIDILVSPDLWDEMKAKHKLIDTGKVRFLRVSAFIDLFTEGSFYGYQKEDTAVPSVKDRLNQAENYDGLYFESLQHTHFFKTLMGRAKDQNDCELIESLLQDASS